MIGTFRALALLVGFSGASLALAQVPEGAPSAEVHADPSSSAMEASEPPGSDEAEPGRSGPGPDVDPNPDGAPDPDRSAPDSGPGIGSRPAGVPRGRAPAPAPGPPTSDVDALTSPALPSAEETARVAGDARPRVPRALEREEGPVPVIVTPPASAPNPLLERELRGFLELLDGERDPTLVIGWILVLAWVFVLGVLVGRGRRRLAKTGVLPAVFSVLHLGLRTVALLMFVGGFVLLLPTRLGLGVVIALGGFALAVGWSFREILPDFIAGIVLVFENRIRRGSWISGQPAGGEVFNGQVEAFDLRTTYLRDLQGHLVAIPNRHLVATPYLLDRTHEREHAVTLVLHTDAPADQVRRALADAVLGSPWVYPGAKPVILRDAVDPRRWRVRGRLLEATYGAHFEGELLERAEEALEEIGTRGPSPEPGDDGG